MHDAKMKTFVTLKFLSSNKAQIEKFDHFSANSIAINASNEEKFALKSSLKSSKIIDFMKQSSETTTLKFETTILTNEKTNEINCMYDAKIKILVTQKFSSLNKTQIEKFNHFLTNSVAIDASNEKKFAFKSSLKS